MSSDPAPPIGLSRRQVLAASAVAFVTASLDTLVGPVEAALAATNGQVPSSQLTTVPGSAGSVPLEINTASAWLNLVAACRASTGVTMVVTSPYGGYRDQAAQQYMYDYPQGPVSIARPGTSSHGWGTAVDVYNRQYSWLTTNAPTYGFLQTFESEQWHWQFHGAVAPPSNPQGVDDMAVVFKVVYDQPGDPKHGTRAIVTPTLIGTANFFRELSADAATQQMGDQYITGANNGNGVPELHLTGQQYVLMSSMVR